MGMWELVVVFIVGLVRHMACSVTASFLASSTFAFRGPVRSAIALA